jgi:hypothetical protein
MKCFCGCGAKVRRGQLDLNLQAPRMALELLAWDKARAAGHLGPPAADDAEREIERGADCYQRLIRALHGESGEYSFAEGEDWLRGSAAERRDRGYMTVKGGFLTRDKLLLTREDEERLDRNRPELSFTGPRDLGGDKALSQLKRLEALRSEGVLTDAEFNTAKARALDQS